MGAIGHELMEEAGFALVEALAVERLLQPEKLVVEVVAEFVEEIPLAMLFLFGPFASPFQKSEPDL